jgi:hypothetical protein
MPWTGEDTKDVFKKVIGGLVAAAILAMVYAIVERVEWYYAAATAAILIALVILLILRLAGPARPAADKAAVSEDRLPASQEPVRSAAAPPDSQEKVGTASDNEKVLKKAVKAEQKRLKKEAKAREKVD